jgi:glycosyltransferase involved in cell wall biosynthesis
MPFFAVIMPCFNAAKHLRETLDTLVSQTFTDWELIAMDDGSSDATLSILHQYAALDPRIIVHTQENSGPSVARNKAALLTDAPYLAFLDADDLWVAQKLTICHQSLTQTDGTHAIFGKINFFAHDHHMPSTSSTVEPRSLNLRDVMGENPICTMSNLVICRTMFLGVSGFDENIVYAEDLEFLARILAAGCDVRGIDVLLVHYRTSTGGLSANLPAMHTGWRNAVESAQNHGALLSKGEIAYAEAIHLRYLARRALRTSQGSDAFMMTLRGITKSPSGFLSNRYRGVATLLASIVAPILPRSLCDRLFSE